MANHDSIVSSDKLEAIADAIREKTHKEDAMTLAEMPDEIRSISGGGGAVPDCGIVPTSYSSQGYVLSANSYGNVQPCAAGNFGGFITDCRAYTPDSDAIFGPDFTESRSKMFAYLKDVSAVTPPEIIGHDAFYNCFWMNGFALNEGVQVIEPSAFSGCHSYIVHSIPSTVTTIGNSAFSGVAHPEYTAPYYSEQKTYAVGDFVYYEDELFTCISPISSPEVFNYGHWARGYYPGMLGKYSDIPHTLHNGDVVYRDGVKTALNVYSSSLWATGYYPNNLGLFDPNRSYSIGDVVVKESSGGGGSGSGSGGSGGSGGGSDLSALTYMGSDSWANGYYPQILGMYSSTSTYSIGDTVGVWEYYDYQPKISIYTCTNTISTPEEFNSYNWIGGYYPGLIGECQPGHYYNIGDVVYYSDYIYTCKVAHEVIDYFDYNNWVEGYCPRIVGDYDDETVYNVGDVVDYYGELMTCIQDGTVGTMGSPYWISGYYPEIVGEFDPSVQYPLGTCAVEAVGPDSRVITLYRLAGYGLGLISGYFPDVIEVYDPEHTYHPGDVVAYNSDGYDISDLTVDIYIYIGNISTSGDEDIASNPYWECIHNIDSVGNDAYRKVPMTILTTPENFGSSAFSSAGYTLYFVPWGCRDYSPWNNQSMPEHYTVYLYNRVCTAYNVTIPAAVGTDSYVPLKVTHETSSDLSLPDLGNIYTVSVSEGAEVVGDMDSGFKIYAGSLAPGDTITVTITSVKDPDYVITRTIDVVESSITFDAMESSWAVVGQKDGYDIYGCSAFDEYCKFTVVGYRRFRIYYTDAQDYVSGIYFVNFSVLDDSDKNLLSVWPHPKYYNSDTYNISDDVDMSVPHNIYVHTTNSSSSVVRPRFYIVPISDND